MADGRQAADGRPVGERARNAPHNSLKAKVEAARDTAPPEYEDDGPAIMTVGWVAWDENREVAEVWAEVRGEA